MTCRILSSTCRPCARQICDKCIRIYFVYQSKTVLSAGNMVINKPETIPVLTEFTPQIEDRHYQEIMSEINSTKEK